MKDISVLIVEDDPMIRSINRQFVERVDGFEVVGEAENFEAAWTCIHNKSPQLVLLDIFFPGEVGTTFLKALRKQEAPVDVILITADRSPETIEMCLRYGAVDYLVKPFQFKRLKQTLAKYRQRRIALHESGTFGQQAIDHLTQNGVNGDHDEQVNSGTDHQNKTYEKILDFFAQHQGESFTAQEIAVYLGVSRITARRYLDALESENRLVMELEYGNVGRPKNKYKLKQELNNGAK